MIGTHSTGSSSRSIHDRTIVHSALPSTPGAFFLVVAAMAGSLLCGCVTQKGSAGKPTPPPPVSQKKATSPDLPGGPVARPVDPSASADSRVVVAIRQLGRVPYDGLTLPLVSPDGRFVATQTGAAPPWEAILAEPGGVIPPAMKLSAYSLPGAPGVQDPASAKPAGAAASVAVQLLQWPTPLPPGLMLGRSADTTGFLVEFPRPDGSRWIGRVEWISGRLTWLVQDDRANAFATLGPAGELAFSRRAQADAPWELVLHARAGTPSGERVLRGPASGAESYLFPCFGFDSESVFAVALPMAGAQPRLSVIAASTGGGAFAITSRAAIPVDPTPLAAYQTVAAQQTPWPPMGDSSAPATLRSGFAFASLASRSMAWLHREGGVTTPLCEGSVAAAPWSASGDASNTGLLLGSGKELLFQQFIPDSSYASGFRASRQVSVVSVAAVPRAVRDSGGRVLVLTPPGRGGDASIGVLELRPAVPVSESPR